MDTNFSHDIIYFKHVNSLHQAEHFEAWGLKARRNICGNLPQSDRQPNSFNHSQADKQTPSVRQRRQYLCTAARGRQSAHQHRR
jgi:hypothetical protein